MYEPTEKDAPLGAPELDAIRLERQAAPTGVMGVPLPNRLKAVGRSYREHRFSGPTDADRERDQVIGFLLDEVRGRDEANALLREGITTTRAEGKRLAKKRDRALKTISAHNELLEGAESLALKQLRSRAVDAESYAEAQTIHLEARTAERDQANLRAAKLRVVLASALRLFTEKGHPGYEALRAGWVEVATIEQWRRVFEETRPGAQQAPTETSVDESGDRMPARRDEG